MNAWSPADSRQARAHLDMRRIFQPGHPAEVQAGLQVHTPHRAQIGQRLHRNVSR